MMYRYLLDAVSDANCALTRPERTPIRVIRAMVSGEDPLHGKEWPGGNGALKRASWREKGQAAVLGWLTQEGFDHHFTYDCISLHGTMKHAVYLVVADDAVAAAIRLRFNALPLREGETSHDGKHWDISE